MGVAPGPAVQMPRSMTLLNAERAALEYKRAGDVIKCEFLVVDFCVLD